MAAIVKLAENLFLILIQRVVNIFTLFFYLILHFNWTYFNFFVRNKMASDVQYGDRNSKEHNFEVCFQFFAMSVYFRQQHKSKAYFVKLVKNGGSIQNGGSKLRFLCITLRIS
jgi:hypothetical protein